MHPLRIAFLGKVAPKSSSKLLSIFGVLNKTTLLKSPENVSFEKLPG
jgi:hypothetical protein